MEPGTLPPKERREWTELVAGEVEHKYSNLVLQMKVHQARKDVKNGNVSVGEAIDGIYEICEKYSIAVYADFELIFGTW